MRYRWNSSLEWLMGQAQTLDEPALRGILVDVIPLLDPDDVQDLFQSEMDNDGFFQDLDATQEDEEE